jgi:CPA1 family monovalent cation:H+ antiporter
VLFWGGLRGAISLALALSLPAVLNTGRPELLRSMAFGVVLFTLLVQGTTMQVLLGKLGLITLSEDRLEYERRHGRLMAARAARNRLEELHRDGMISSTTRQQLAGALDNAIQEHLDAQNELLNEHPQLNEEDLHSARRETLRAQRALLALLARDGAISEPIYEELVTELDAALDSAESA